VARQDPRQGRAEGVETVLDDSEFGVVGKRSPQVRLRRPWAGRRGGREDDVFGVEGGAVGWGGGEMALAPDEQRGGGGQGRAAGGVASERNRN
jgi:hypothetical protein